jgi:CubicO group peptidase (beta-lactamase class C family)
MSISASAGFRRLLKGSALLLISSAAFAYPAPPPDPNLPKSDVPVAIQQLRRAMMDSEVNTLTFHNMDQIFTTRTVGRAGPVWKLPRADRELDFTYEYKGQQYTPEDFLERTYTNALLVMKDGRIVYENYRNNTNDATRFIVWSATKSLVGLMVGVAVNDGFIKSVDDPITRYLPELKGGGYDGATVKNILQMRSGVDYEERYDFGNPGTAARNHELALVTNVVRFADAARSIKRKHPPGQVFQYKTLDTAVLGWLLERVTGRTLASYMAEKFWEPLGTERDAFFIMDGAPGVGREFSGAGFNATVRDLARIGLMMLNEGKGNGRQIIPPQWVRDSVQPGTPGPGPGYGYQWWLVDNSRAYFALGLQGQYIYVNPDTRTVIVKVSYFPPENQTAHEEVAAFFEAASRWQAR